LLGRTYGRGRGGSRGGRASRVRQRHPPQSLCRAR
jgi:hypothetical protein